jgi:phospholipase C
MSTFTAAGLNAYEAAHGWYSFHRYYNGGQNGENVWAYGLPNADNVTNKPTVIAHNVQSDIPFHWWMATTFAPRDY